MVTYEYDSSYWTTFRDGIRLEWALTNGIGGYAGSSLTGAHNRTHQGFLIASLHPPIERYLVFSKINESVRGAADFSFETSQHRKNGKTFYANGQNYLESFCYDGSVHYTYQAGAVSMKKHICLKQGENVCAIGYELKNRGADATFTLVPLFNFREHSQSSRPEDLAFTTECTGHTFSLIPKAHADIAIRFQVSEGEFCKRDTVYDVDMELQTEVDLETAGLDCHYCPILVSVFLPAGCSKKISVLCSVTDSSETLPEITSDTAFSLLDARKAYTKRVFETYTDVFHTAPDDFTARLLLASDQFLSARESTGLKTVLAGLPWFTDWGRDTMIAFTGLTLASGRFDDAKEILLTFSKYIKNGIVPNMFPDNNTPPLYNTADASLWYFYAVWQYLQYVDTPDAKEFVKKEVYPHLLEIISAYRDGTDFSIYMDEDGLIHAGSGLDQITWMDVRVGDWVVTPRHGKPVEINALWYNALCIMEKLSALFSDSTLTPADFHAMAERTKTSFCEKFWDEKNACLYDVIDDRETALLHSAGASQTAACDDHIRPNQIYAVSLPFSMLPEEKERAVVELVKRELYVGCGLRSLASGHPDYHGIYCGSLPKRDAAYHQGTAWGFLLGGFLTAFLKVNHHSKESVKEALALLAPVRRHLFEGGCIGSISEIFDGDAPHHPRGCYAQAWSVGEVLRAYTQDVLPYLPKE
jgi:predicted glycogen debranching enzyme